MKQYVAQPKQQLFHFATADEVLYGGSAGGGKSYSIVWDAVSFAMENPKVAVAIFRRTYPELEKSIIMTALDVIPAHWYNYNKKEHRMYFKNGSIIEFNYCQFDSDVYNFQSAQYQRIYFDELTHFSEFIYMYLQSRCRTPSHPGIKAQIKAASNPGNIGHEWVKQRFGIGKDIPGEEIIRYDTNSGVKYTTQFIPARVTDNKYIIENDPEYVNRLMKQDPVDRRALLDGDWDILKGQYFSEWRYDKHVVVPFEIPEWWTRIRTLDWGYAKPACVLWIAFSPEGLAFVYRELSVTEYTDIQLSAKILQLSEGEKYEYTTADPSIWSVNQYEKGESVAYRMMGMGIPLIKADNARIGGWNVLHSYLYWEDADEEKNTPVVVPKMKVFQNCTYLIKSLPGLIRDEKNPEDLDTRGDDHAADALRYGLMSKPVLPKEQTKNPPQNSVEYWLKKFKDERSKNGYAGTL